METVYFATYRKRKQRHIHEIVRLYKEENQIDEALDGDSTQTLAQNILKEIDLLEGNV